MPTQAGTSYPGAADVGAVPPPPFLEFGTEPPDAPPPRRRGLAVALILGALLLAGAIVAVVLATSSSKGSSSSSSGGGPKPAPSPSLVPPSAVTAAAGPFQVVLTWSQPPGGSTIAGYSIYRNGTLEGSVNVPTLTFTDTTVLPGRTYTYEVEATGTGVVSTRTSVEVKTRIPPLTVARVEGTFNVHAKVLDKSGFTSFQDSFTLGWRFTPKCSKGPCNILWKDISQSTLSAVLTRSGTTYTGTDSGDFNVRCGSQTTTTTVVIDFHVAHAGAVDGAWRATKLVGTLTQSNPSQLGCVSSHATMQIIGTLLS